MKKCSDFIKKQYPILLFILVWVIMTMFDYKFGKQYLDSDMASEMVLANQLNKEGVLLSKNWFYSTEIRILGNAQLFRLPLLVFPNNWRIARTIAQSFLLLLTGISYYYLTTPLKSKKNSILFATFTMCPFGFWYMWHGTFSGFYLIWIVAYNLCAGLIFRISLFNENKKIRWVSLILISFVLGLQSVRSLMNLQVPLLLTCIVVIKVYMYKNNIELRNFKNVLPSYKKFVVSSSISTFCSLIGYAINTFYLSKIYTYANQNNITWKNFSLKEALTILEDFLKLWGYPYNFTYEMKLSLFSIDGILCIFGFCLMIIVLIGLVWLIKNVFLLKVDKQVIGLSCLSVILVPFMIFLFFKYENASYFLPGIGIMIAGLQVSFESLDFKMFRKLVHVEVVVCVFLSSISTSNLLLKYPPRSDDKHIYITSLLEEKGYTQCIGEFWAGGNVITELSNGKIESWIVNEDDYKSIYKWLQNKDHANDLPQGKCAVILTVEVCDRLIINPFAYEGGETLYVDDTYIVIGVDDAADFFHSIM